ncbi:unnamed protein product [Haemonchus placei]|uniref:Uncharacterized protein n=1 Tax=Haemonchus placei TaxID=6290 RepID=A0A0N4X8W2_HAEPC|nr:unnamed protein product [Haemonchus placei]
MVPSAGRRAESSWCFTLGWNRIRYALACDFNHIITRARGDCHWIFREFRHRRITDHIVYLKIIPVKPLTP